MERALHWIWPWCNEKGFEFCSLMSFQNLYVGNLTCKKTMLRRVVFRKWLGHESFTFLKSSLAKEAWVTSGDFLLSRAFLGHGVCPPWRLQQQSIIWKQREVLTRCWDHWPLILDFPASKTWNNKFLLFIHYTVLGLIAPKEDKINIPGKETAEILSCEREWIVVFKARAGIGKSRGLKD